jgi:hypothetical protein
MALAFAPVAHAGSLNNFYVTMQFNGTAHTVWSFPPTAPVDDGCEISTDSGSGTQTYDYAMHHRRVYLHIVDAGATIAFQLPHPTERANQNHVMPGFREVTADRIGYIKTVYSISPLWTTGCGPIPEESFADTSGCGGRSMPWDMTPIDLAGKFMPEVAAYPPSEMLTQCPFYGPSDVGFPTDTQTHVPLSELRSVLSKKHGKLIIRGQHRWHTEGLQGRYDLTITTTVDWTMILIRAHPSPADLCPVALKPDGSCPTP